MGEISRSTVLSKEEDAAEQRDKTPDERTETSPKEERAPEKSDKRAQEQERGVPRKTEGGTPAASAPSGSPPSTTWRAFPESPNSSPPDSSVSRGPAKRYAEDETSRSWHVSTDAQGALPLFGDLPQLNLPRLGTTQFPGFTARASLLGKSDPAKPRDADSSSPSQSLFDFPGSTNPLFPFGDVPRAGEGTGASPPVQWFPVFGGDWRLPGWPESGATGRLKNITIGFPGFPGLGPLPLGVLPEIPIFPTLADLLQDPLNIEQLQALFKEALTQIQESPLNAEKLKDTVEEIIRRVTPQESVLVKQLVRAHKERDASRVKGVAEAILDAAGRVGQQLKVLKEVPIAATVDGDVTASGSSFTLLGDVKEVLDIEEAFTNFRSVLEQLLGPLLSALPAFTHSNWAVPNWG